MTFSQWFKKQSLLFKGLVIGGIAFPILKLNEQQQSISSDGSFSFSYTLQSGENILSFTSTSVLGNTTKKELTITYNPPPPPPAPTVQQPPPQQPAGDVTVHEGQEEPYSE